MLVLQIAADSDYTAAAFKEVNVNWLAVDFRGYGWSTGSPLLSTLTSDAESVVPALPNILREHGYESSPLMLFGRSIGSTCAVHLASKYSHIFKALVIESGLTVITELPMVARLAMMIPGGDQLLGSIPDIFQQRQKLSTCPLPLLVIHGEDDQIAPVQQGQDLYDASPSPMKQLCRLPDAGHNDLLHVHHTQYFATIQNFVTAVLSGSSATATTTEAAVAGAGSAAQACMAKLREAQDLMHAGRYNDAVTVITELFRSGKKVTSEMQCDLCSTRAHCFAKLGRYQDCVDDCSTVLNIRPEDVNALTLRMKAYWKQGITQFAVRDANALSRQQRQRAPGVAPETIDAIIAIALLTD
jgi:pimeloyl-ACP methyl ester carboxylesterase